MLTALLLASASAQAPLTHSGRLLDTNGAPLQGTVDLRLSLYASEAASSAFWTKLYDDLAVDSGYYSVVLLHDDDDVALDPDDFAGGQAWVGLEADGLTLGSRQQLGTAPYAMSAAGVQLPDRPVGACSAPGTLYWDSASSVLHVCTGTTSQVITPDPVAAVEAAETLSLSADPTYPISLFGSGFGDPDFLDRTAFAVCASRHPTFRYLEKRGSGTCANKCSDSEFSGAGCLAAIGLGGNTTPWADNGCNSTTSSIEYCCCTW